MAKALSDAEFVELLTSTQVRLRMYALALVRESSDADDVVQCACLALWEKRQSFDPERSFFSWACGVVLTEVLRLRRKRATDKLMFGEALINTLAAEYLAHTREIDERRALLHNCVENLSQKDRSLLEERYTEGTKTIQIAKSRGVPPTTMYSALSRIREALFRCVESGLAQHSHPRVR